VLGGISSTEKGQEGAHTLKDIVGLKMGSFVPNGAMYLVVEGVD